MENAPRRTPILWILGIITMVNAAFSAIAYISWALAPEYMLKSMETIRNMDMFSEDQVEQIISLYTSIQSWQYILLAIVSVALFVGAFMMLVKLKKVGFHIYTIGKILEFCVMNFVIGGMVAMDFNGIITSVLWVLMYATQLRFLEPVEDQDNNPQTPFPFQNNNGQNRSNE